jgi:hypothetical protein
MAMKWPEVKKSIKKQFFVPDSAFYSVSRLGFGTFDMTSTRTNTDASIKSSSAPCYWDARAYFGALY